MATLERNVWEMAVLTAVDAVQVREGDPVLALRRFGAARVFLHWLLNHGDATEVDVVTSRSQLTAMLEGVEGLQADLHSPA